MRRPVNEPYIITTEFGVPDSAALYGRHAGIDYAKGIGSDVYAPVSGTVTDYVWGAYHGNVVQLAGDDGRYHRLMHNLHLLVYPGQKVTEGERVSLSGDTGLGVTGPHVHWDIAREKFPSSFESFYAPASLLFAAAAPQPPLTEHPAGNLAGRVVYLHPVAQWSVYRVDQQPIRTQRIGFLSPINYSSGLPAPKDKGLTYTIVSNGQFANTVVINTSTYGQVSIYLDGDAEIL